MEMRVAMTHARAMYASYHPVQGRIFIVADSAGPRRWSLEQPIRAANSSLDGLLPAQQNVSAKNALFAVKRLDRDAKLGFLASQN
jgi:hypothetical protein